MTLRLDYTNMIAADGAARGTSGGIAEKDWLAAADRFRAAHRAVGKRHSDGSLGWIDLPDDKRLLAQTTDFAAARRGRFTDVVILGIGGSALGPIALRTALRPSGWNSLESAARDGFPKLHVLDNVDPETIAALLGRLPLTTTLFIVTSKSGGTAETMAQYLV